MNDALSRTDHFMHDLGVEVYRVGGSVRDELLGRRAKDADYIVRGLTLLGLGSALAMHAPKPKGLKPLKTRDGRQVGWIVNVRGAGNVDVVLPRREISTGPGHRDFEIVVDPALGLSDDAERRDFTFNALYKLVGAPGGDVALNPDGIADPTDCGLYDLQHKLVRTTHADSFRDDPLRILRALRFVSTLGYDLASCTRDQMHAHAEAVTGLTAKGVSGTVLSELSKLLMGRDAVKALRLARDTGVLAVVLPELEPMIGFEQGSRYHDLTTDEHTFSALETAVHVDAPARVRWALLFHDSGKPATAWRGLDGRLHYYEPDDKTWDAVYNAIPGHSDGATAPKPRDHELVSEERWLEAAFRLNAPNDLRKDVAKLIRNHMVGTDGKLKGSKVRRERVRLGDALLRDLYLHRMCDLAGKGKPDKQALQRIGMLEHIRAGAQEWGVPASVKELQISGRDVMELGVEGRHIGQVLAAVLDEVVCQPSEQTLSREWQLERVKQLA